MWTANQQTTEIRLVWLTHRFVAPWKMQKSVLCDINKKSSDMIKLTSHDLCSALKKLNFVRQWYLYLMLMALQLNILFTISILHMYLSILSPSFISYDHLPDDFFKSAIVPIIKNKTGDSSVKNNYRPIASVTALSKII